MCREQVLLCQSMTSVCLVKRAGVRIEVLCYGHTVQNTKFGCAF